MTKDEFYKKWQHGANPHMWFYNKQCMFDDLDRVIHAALCDWKKHAESECKRTIDLDEFMQHEAEEIEKRK